jgi:hypothetical protein
MNNQDNQPGKAPVDLSYDAPDFSQMGANTPVKPKKPKTKKVKPKLVVRNHPELTKGMKVGQKHKAMVHITPTLIRNEQGTPGPDGSPGGGHLAEFDVHNMQPMGPVAEPPTAAGAGEVPPNFSSLGKRGGPASAPEEEETA